MLVISVRYTLRNGARGTLSMIAASTTAAIVCALDLFGDRLRTASASSATGGHMRGATR